MENSTTSAVLALVRRSLWGTGEAAADQAVFEEMRQQTLVALPASCLSSLSMTPELRAAWKAAVYQQITANVNLRRAQEALPVTVPYTVLKGTSAAQYYPHPEYRALGDIDLMTRREDFETACRELLAAGYAENTVMRPEGVVRHRRFLKNGVEVEVHAYFAMMSRPEQAEYLDGLIMDGINDTHVLPDPVNGLVILHHIGQHLEEGLGLRQILDWMMFADRCLSDAQWPAFSAMAERTGMLSLARITTRMCEMYLGLPPRSWCAGADEDACASLMDYVMRCGNFGAKREYGSFRSEKVLTVSRSPRALLRLLQRRGVKHWPVFRKYPLLRPFAWLCQGVHYIASGLGRSDARRRLRAELEAARERNALFTALDIPRGDEGLTVYENGRYVKKN